MIEKKSEQPLLLSQSLALLNIIRTFVQTKHPCPMTMKMIKETVADYFKNQPVLKAWLFGSFSRGEETADSDVDIIVLLDKSNPIGLKFFGMWSELEELLGRRVDLVSEGTLLPFAQKSAEKERILIYERGK